MSAPDLNNKATADSSTDPSSAVPAEAPAPPDAPAPPAATSPPTPHAKPWSPTGIAWICVLFTLLPAGIMYALNFERLGQPEKKQRALFVVLSASLLYYLALIGVFFVIGVHPELEKMSTSVNMWFTVISIGMAWYFYLRQQPLFKARIGQGARKAPLFVPFLLSGLWMAAFACALFGWAYFENVRDIRSFETAVALMEKGRHQQAEAIFKDYKARYPDDVAVYFNLAAIYLETDRVPQARHELEVVLQQDPGNQEAKDLLRDIEPL